MMLGDQLRNEYQGDRLSIERREGESRILF